MLADENELFWGDAHVNIHPEHFDVLQDTFDAAREVHDFWPIAYYPFLCEDIGGFLQETERQRPEFLEQWKTICRMSAEANEPGRFVCFPGYEWHGLRRRWGDHNVFYKTGDGPLDDAETLRELYDHLRPLDAIAIPHHTAYGLGHRGKDWSVMDEHLSPFVEIFSTHGSSEGYGSPFPMGHNTGMGPLAQEGSVPVGLGRGYHFGIIASGDLHAKYPTQWGTGLMACYAPELTRDALWDAFHARQVYGTTGDRIKLDFGVAGIPMGGIGQAKPPYTVTARVEGSDAIARIEILRNNVLLDGRFFGFDPERVPAGRTRYKFRAVFGWGPRKLSHPGLKLPDAHWDVEMALEDGTLVGIERMWNRFGQRIDEQTASGCRFHLRTESPETRLHTTAGYQGMGFEVEGTPETRVRMTINGRPHTFTLAEARRFPVIWAEEEACERILQEWHGITVDGLLAGQYDPNTVWHTAHKTHVWPAVHEGEFAVTAEWEDTPDRPGESWYTLRVIQNNGQAAWSSPIWVTPNP